MPSFKFVFFGPIGKTLYSGLRYVALGPLIYVLSRNENKGVGFGRANDIVTCYHNLSYSLNWSAVDRGTSRRPTANLMETLLRPLRSL